MNQDATAAAMAGRRAQERRASTITADQLVKRLMFSIDSEYAHGVCTVSTETALALLAFIEGARRD